jgi:tRNA/rRNA methyltransferase
MLTRFILINTSHAGNVGAAARAMKTMGFDDLVLVAPRWPNVLRREETIQRASGALDVLDKCRIVDTLDEALDGMTHLCATAMTPRDFGPPTVAPRQHFESLSKTELHTHIPRGLEAYFTNESSQQGMGFLFGSERFGMRNEDVYRCHACLSIPSNPKFGSLNIGAALQVVAYEWRLALGGFADIAEPEHSVRPELVEGLQALTSPARTAGLADAAQVAGMLTHLEQSLVALGFLDPAAPKKLMPRLNQLFNRAGVTQEEIHILRGIAKAILQQSAGKADAGP